MNVESCSALSSNDELVEQAVDATDVGNDTVDENEFNLIFLAEERRDQLLVFFRSHGNATACMCVAVISTTTPITYQCKLTFGSCIIDVAMDGGVVIES